MSGAARRLDSYHVHMGMALSGSPVGTWCCVRCSSVCVDIDVTSTSATLNLIENEFESPAGGRVEDLLKK